MHLHGASLKECRPRLASEGLAELRDRGKRPIFEEHESGTDSEASIADPVEIVQPDDNLVAEINHENNLDLLVIQDEEQH